MKIELDTPQVGQLGEVVRVLGEWQSDEAPFQLHPGDIGWFWRSGAEATAAGLRTWSGDGRVVAVGLLDEPDLLRMTVAPDARGDEELARRLVDDIDHSGRGVLPEGKAYVEAPVGAAVHHVLSSNGWRAGDSWTPLSRDLVEPVERSGLRVEMIGPDQASMRSAVHRAAFDKSTFTVDRWRLMADGVPYTDARCLVGYDDDGNGVAAVTVWSAGPGRPGLLEPMGVHRDHRGRGYGRAITLAAAAALREMGSSSAIVATPSTNVAAVATYASAGFERLPERLDRYRDA